jgi:L-alanine-DL-glutamate epimerase-like enolase superfamily enzyme
VKVTEAAYDLELEIPFSISRDTTTVRPISIAEVRYGDIAGYGEASPSGYYGDSPELASNAIRGADELLGDDPFALHLLSDRLAERFPDSPSGRAAVEVALFDVMGKVAGQPVFRMLGLSGMRPPLTSLTVGVSDVSLAEARLESLSRFPILKAKVGFGDEEALLRLLSEGTESAIRVDANEGWTLDEAISKMKAYRARYGVEFFEQPLPKEDLDGYRELMERTEATIIVDESVRCKEDVVRWSGAAHGINIKLMKCGGLLEALRMIWAARSVGMRVMLGCMVESSVAITAAAHIAPLADYCDLDGNLLIANDPFQGVKGYEGVLSLPEVPGLGVRPGDR